MENQVDRFAVVQNITASRARFAVAVNRNIFTGQSVGKCDLRNQFFGSATSARNCWNSWKPCMKLAPYGGDKHAFSISDPAFGSRIRRTGIIGRRFSEITAISQSAVNFIGRNMMEATVSQLRL